MPQTGKRKVIAKGGSAFYSAAQVYGDVAYVSGQVGIVSRTPEGKPILAEGGVGPETQQALTNLKNVLESSGSSLDNVLKVTAYLSSMDDYTPFNDEYLKYFNDAAIRPARVCFAVAALPFGAKVEVECTAAVTPPSRL